MTDDLVKRLDQALHFENWMPVPANFSEAVPLLRESRNRIEELEAKLTTCEKYRDAYAECDRIGAQAVRDLEAKLAKAVEVGNKMAKSIEGNYYIPNVAKEWRTTLAELKGQDDD